MTDNQDNKNTGRSTLTLKLKPASSVQTITIKQPIVENKRINKSSFQVTIKGRKKEAKDEVQGLNKNEVEARFRAVSNSRDSESQDLDSGKILSKAIKEKRKEQALEEEQAAAVQSPTQEEETKITEVVEKTEPLKINIVNQSVV